MYIFFILGNILVTVLKIKIKFLETMVLFTNFLSFIKGGTNHIYLKFFRLICQIYIKIKLKLKLKII